MIWKVLLGIVNVIPAIQKIAEYVKDYFDKKRQRKLEQHYEDKKKMLGELIAKLNSVSLTNEERQEIIRKISLLNTANFIDVRPRV